MNQTPSITLFVCGFNQEEYVSEAIRGALAQTFQPLEIILSDDCSTDNTFEIMSRAASSYRGPHKVVLNRNEVNLGITGHYNKIAGIAKGRWIVTAAGDDISLPDRITELNRAWVSSGYTASSIYSNSIVINQRGKRLFVQRRPGEATQAHSPQEAVDRCSVGISGCAYAFQRKVFELFGPLHEGGTFEDHAIGFRSLFLGPVLYVEKPLLMYREHRVNQRHGSRGKMCIAEERFLRGWLTDVSKALELGLLAQAEADGMVVEIQKAILSRQWEGSFTTRDFCSAIKLALKYSREGNSKREILRTLYRARMPNVVKRTHKLLRHDLLHPSSIYKSMTQLIRG